jgi:hypothetical protein
MPTHVSTGDLNDSNNRTSQKDSGDEKIALDRLQNSPLKFNKGIQNVAPQYETSAEWNQGDSTRIEIGLRDGFDFNDSLK